MSNKISPENKEKLQGFFKEVFKLVLVFFASLVGVNI